VFIAEFTALVVYSGRRREGEIGGHRCLGRKYYLDLREYPESEVVSPKRPTYPADYTIVMK
jgi:hypothetical protein